MSSHMRLQRYLSQGGICSRRKGEEYIAQGRVAVNGVVITELGTKVDPAVDSVTVDGEPVSVEEFYVYAFHKPANVITTMNDDQGRNCVGDYVEDLPIRVFPVGRLDRDVRGLLLLTNDGNYSNSLAHPRHGVLRTYLAVVQGLVTDEHCNKLCEGVMLSDGFGKAVAASVAQRTPANMLHFGKIHPRNSLVSVTVNEGRNHFVKNIFSVIDRPVVELVRTEFGPHKLGSLKPGHFRKEKR